MELFETRSGIFDVFEAANVLPHYWTGTKDEVTMTESSKVDSAYKDYLEFNAVLELGASQRRNQPNLEDVGLLKVSYKEIENIAKGAEWAGVPELCELTQKGREDYLTGFLDIMRYRTALAYHFLIKPDEFKERVERRLNEEALFHNELRTNYPEGFSDDANPKTRKARITRFSAKTGQLVGMDNKSYRSR